MADTIQITGIEERIKKLGEASMKNPVMRKRVNEVIRATMRKVRKNLQENARSGLGMNSDPRKAYKAVRMAVYRRLFGGQVNILQSRKAKPGKYYEPPRKPSKLGGNRVKQSDRTKQMMTYEGIDRGFILRFLNSGTQERRAKTMGGKALKDAPKHGNRGKISARNWFGRASQQEMEKATAELDKTIDDIIMGILY